MAAENKTKPTTVSVDDFIAALEPAERREDTRVICEMMTRLSGEPATLWGPTILGFGAYHYRYDSGREGDSIRVGFSPRKPAFVLYMKATSERPDLLAKLGKHTVKGGCLHVKRLRDIDLPVLEEMVVNTLAYMDAHYPR